MSVLVREQFIGLLKSTAREVEEGRDREGTGGMAWMD